ncbi:hypothetical protein F2P56_024674 [Juglans regia]|uniref:Retrotransposon Copia-like N-terminal domain-containing protein n=1 Tax=Juglans regia TaxID=51240 RepID=A0A833TUU5_JUGRE|nr:hypothetical protein F2P56_024674 [Juglans regia]
MASSSTVFIAPNLNQLVSAKLDGSNYLIWLSQMVLILKSNDLMGFVDGFEPCPSQFLLDAQGKFTTDLNPNYVFWHKKDQFVLGWINTTLSSMVAPLVFGITSARSAWITLEKKFASKSHSRVSHLKRKLQALSQGSRSCSVYLDEAKEIAAQLSATGKTVEDDDLITYVTHGLNPSYLPFMTSLSLPTRDKPLSFDDFETELLSNELLLDTQFKSVSPETNNFALFAPKHTQQFFNGKPKYPNRSTQPSFSGHSPSHFPSHRNSIPHSKPASNTAPPK